MKIFIVHIIVALVFNLNCIGQDGSTTGVLIYKNAKRIHVDSSRHSFILRHNETQNELDVHSEQVSLGVGRWEQVEIVHFPAIRVDSTDSIELVFDNSKYTITSNLNHFVKGDSLKISGPLFYFYFSSFKKYEKFCSTHNCYPMGYSVTEDNFMKWHLFYFIVGHERWPYVPIEIISVMKN